VSLPATYSVIAITTHMFCRVGQVRTSFYVALPHDGSFSASFEADDGQAIWPLFAQLRFLDELGQCAAAGPELLVFVDLETVKLPAECAGDSNDDFDAGAEGWSHEISSGSRMAVAAEPLPRGGVNTYGVSARRRTSTDGPSQYLDTRCFLTPAAIGAKYLLTAQVRFHNVLDSGEADRSHPPDCFVNGQNCATASLVVERKHREPHSEELLPSVSYDIGAQVSHLALTGRSHSSHPLLVCSHLTPPYGHPAGLVLRKSRTTMAIGKPSSASSSSTRRW